MRIWKSFVAKNSKLLNEFFFSLIAQFFVVLIGFANGAILARILNVEDYGLYQLLITWIATGAVFGLPGFGVVISKGMLKNYDRIFRLSLFYSCTVSFVASALLVISSAILDAVNVISRGQLVLVLLVAASIPVYAFQNVDSILVGKREFRLSRYLLLFSTSLTFFLTVLVAWASGDARWVCLAFLTAKLISTLLSYKIATSKLSFVVDKDKEKERELMRQGWRQMLTTCFLMLAMRADRLILGALDPKLLAIFHIATLIPLQIKNNGKMMLAIFSSSLGAIDGKHNAHVLKRYTGVLLLFGLFCFASMWVLLPKLITFFYGEKYAEAAPVGVIFSMVLVPCFWINMVGMENQYQLSGQFNQWSQVVRYLLLILLVWSTNHLGLAWVAASHVFSDAVYAILTFFYLKRRTKKL